jgi:hypothetical protein
MNYPIIPADALASFNSCFDPFSLSPTHPEPAGFR